MKQIFQFSFWTIMCNSLQKKYQKTSKAACPSSLSSVRVDCPDPSRRRRRSRRRNSSSSSFGTSVFPPPAVLLHKQQPFTQQTPPNESCLFAVKIVESGCVCLRSLRRLCCRLSSFLYSFISPPVCCLAPRLISEGRK